MTLTKYRMITENGYIETIDEQEAIAHGEYVTITEEVAEETNTQL